MGNTVLNRDGRSEARKLYDCLQGLHFLHRLKMEELEQLLCAMKKRRCPTGTTVYRQGDKADAFFLVGSGRLGIWHRQGFKNTRLGDVLAEEYFGENSLISESPRSSTVVAEADCELYVLYKQDFERILMANPQIAANIKGHMAAIRAAKPA